jgi:nuclear pore complex protein Nup107
LSKLPNEIQIKRYSKFLQSISDNKERQHLLKLAKERNMNIQAITLNIVDIISRKSLTNGTPNRTINQTVAAAASSLSTTTTTTSVIMNKTTDQLFSIKKTNQLLTEEDKTRINAIDWIVYDSIQRFKLLEYANLTMRYFLLERENFEATNAIFSKIPADTISIILQQYNFNSTLGGGGGGGTNINQLVENNLQLMLDNLPLNVTNTIKEYIGFKEYIEAVNIYNDWFEFYHREKPVKPMPKFDLDLAQTNQQQSGMDQSNIFAERIAYDYQLKQYQDLLTRWNSKAKIYCDKSRLKFYSLLKFPFLGWMVDIKQSESFNISDDDDDDDDDNESEEESGDAIMNEDGGDSVMKSTEPVNENKQRLKQMKNLRRVYLPNVCFVLIDMLSKMKLNKELIRVSDVVAAEHYKLYTLFDTKQIKCLLNKIADASIALLDEDSDLLGY